MRLDDSASGLIDELDKTLITDRTYEIVVHWSIANDLTISCARGVRVVLPTEMRDACHLEPIAKEEWY